MMAVVVKPRHCAQLTRECRGEIQGIAGGGLAQGARQRVQFTKIKEVAVGLVPYRCGSGKQSLCCDPVSSEGEG